MLRSRPNPYPTVLLTILAAGALPISAGTSRSIAGAGDLEVIADPARATLSVSSERHGFALELPLSDTWSFDSDEHRPLGASDGRYTLDVRARERTEGDTWSQLDDYLDELVESRADIRFPQLVEADEGSVICVQVRNDEHAPWRWFYWTLIPSGKRWLQLALFDTATEPLEPYDLDIVRRLADGFVALEPDAEPEPHAAR